MRRSAALPGSAARIVRRFRGRPQILSAARSRPAEPAQPRAPCVHTRFAEQTILTRPQSRAGPRIGRCGGRLPAGESRPEEVALSGRISAPLSHNFSYQTRKGARTLRIREVPEVCACGWEEGAAAGLFIGRGLRGRCDGRRWGLIRRGSGCGGWAYRRGGFAL